MYFLCKPTKYKLPYSGFVFVNFKYIDRMKFGKIISRNVYQNDISSRFEHSLPCLQKMTC